MFRSNKPDMDRLVACKGGGVFWRREDGLMLIPASLGRCADCLVSDPYEASQAADHHIHGPPTTSESGVKCHKRHAQSG
jgi:hypothetical protein